MKKELLITVLLSCFFAFYPHIAKSDGGETPLSSEEASSLRKLISEQSKIIKDLTARVNALESKKNEQSQVINDLKTKMNTFKSKNDEDLNALPLTLENIAPRASWAERTVFKGDFRYRHEYIDDKLQTSNQTKSKSPRNRHRIRARVGFNTKVVDDLDFNFQLTTDEAKGSEGDPASGNQTLSNAFSKKSIWVDLAYVDWRPKNIFNFDTTGLSIYAGKMKDPFVHVGKSQLILDADITPEGGALGYEFKCNDKLKLYTNVGGFWVQERAGSLTKALNPSTGLYTRVEDAHVDSSLWVFQGGFKVKPFDPVEINSGLSLYNFNNVRHSKFFVDTASNAGNSFAPFVPPGGTAYNAYEKQFNIVNPYVDVKFKLFNIPVLVYNDWAINARPSDNVGTCIGYTINKAEKPNSWEFTHEYRILQPDAVIGAFTDSDFSGGLTGFKGNKFNVKYQITKNVDIQSTLFLAQIDTRVKFRDMTVDRFSHGTQDVNRWEDYIRWQLDMNVKF